MVKAKLLEIIPEPLSENLIERAEWLLEQVKAGGVSAISVAIVYRDGMSGEMWSRLPSCSTMIGAIERMKHSIMTKYED